MPIFLLAQFGSFSLIHRSFLYIWDINCWLIIFYKYFLLYYLDFVLFIVLFFCGSVIFLMNPNLCLFKNFLFLEFVICRKAPFLYYTNKFPFSLWSLVYLEFIFFIMGGRNLMSFFLQRWEILY